MTKSFFLIALFAATATAFTPLAAESENQPANGRKISTSMNGAAEPGGGDIVGTGTFSARINPGREQLCYTMTYQDIAPATAAHIHKAAAGAAGPPVVPLSVEVDGSVEDCVPVTRELAMKLIQHPEDYYVNVHNQGFPAGAIRGQLEKGSE
jgi:hypothetical protein